MDNFMNNHQYSMELVSKYPEICVYNAFKPENVPKVRESLFYNRYVYLKTCPLPPFIRCMELFRNENDQTVVLPDYVISQITDAISTLNICPSPLRMVVKDSERYALYAKYVNEKVLVKNEPKTIIELEYVFPKTMKIFDGYFSQNSAKEEQLPKYEVVKKEGAGGGTFLRITYVYNKKETSTLDVTIQVGTKKCIEELDWIAPVSKDLKYISPARSLFAAISQRIIPTTDFFMKFLTDIILQLAVDKFHDHMNISTLSECRYASQLDEMSTYMLLDKKNKYPFLTSDGAIDEDVCLYDVWTQYFEKELTPEHAKKMKLSNETKENLWRTCYRNPTQRENLVTLFPSLKSMIAFQDYKERLELLKQMKGLNDEDVMSSEDIIHLNWIKSKMPTKWRYFLRRNEASVAVPYTFETGDEVVKRRRLNPPTDLIDEINYFYASHEDTEDLSFFQLMSEDVTLLEAETLNPSVLEERFQTYSFSENYKTIPTKQDCLAVRFANVYKDQNYDVPTVPRDFYDRFIVDVDMEPDEKTGFQNLCVVCKSKEKTHIFTVCTHLCLCELCSLYVLKCPICSKPGNPRKVYM